MSFTDRKLGLLIQGKLDVFVHSSTEVPVRELAYSKAVLE